MSKSKLIKSGIEVVGGVARNNLERLGSLLDSIEANTEKATHYEAVDLDSIDDSDNLIDDSFRKTTLEASEQIVGKRIARYGKYARKVVPNSVMNKAMDTTFSQVAKLAATWSELELPNENRMANIHALSEHERNALATDIANQNRALATMGGVTGLAGLPGLLADTIWLLLVSLRTVYQIAAVYDTPLTGKQGVKMAYRVLENADLSKMHEKQALLAGIGMSKRLLSMSGMHNDGLFSSLDDVGLSDETVKFYAEQVESITEQFNFDLDKIDLSWLVRFIPLTSVAVGAYYNNYLINQVIGVANATFAPEPKMAKRANIKDDSKNVTDSDSKSENSESENNNSTGKLDELKDTVKNKASEAKSVVDGVKDKATTIKDDVVEKANEVKNTATGGVATMAKDIKDTATDDINTLKGNVKDSTDKAKDDIKNKVKDDASDLVETVKETVAKDVKETVDSVKETVKDTVNDIKSTVTEDAKTLAGDIKNVAKEDAKQVAKDIKDTAKNNAKAIVDDTKETVSGSKDSSKNKQDKDSDSESDDNRSNSEGNNETSTDDDKDSDNSSSNDESKDKRKK